MHLASSGPSKPVRRCHGLAHQIIHVGTGCAQLPFSAFVCRDGAVPWQERVAQPLLDEDVATGAESVVIGSSSRSRWSLS